MMQISHSCWGSVATAMIRPQRRQAPDRETFDKILREKRRSVNASEKAPRKKRR